MWPPPGVTGIFAYRVIQKMLMQASSQPAGLRPPGRPHGVVDAALTRGRVLCRLTGSGSSSDVTKEELFDHIRLVR